MGITSLINERPGNYGIKKSNDFPSKKPDNPDVPEETSELTLTEDIFSNTLSPRSATNSHRQINLGT